MDGKSSSTVCLTLEVEEVGWRIAEVSVILAALKEVTKSV
jgi:hypothetical protein